MSSPQRDINPTVIATQGPSCRYQSTSRKTVNKNIGIIPKAMSEKNDLGLTPMDIENEKLPPSVIKKAKKRIFLNRDTAVEEVVSDPGNQAHSLVEELQVRNNQLISQNNEIEARIKIREAALKKANQEADKLEKQNGDLAVELDKQKKDYAMLQNEYGEFKERSMNKDRVMNGDRLAFANEKKQLETEIASLKSRTNQLQVYYDELKKQKDQFTINPESVKEEALEKAARLLLKDPSRHQEIHDIAVDLYSREHHEEVVEQVQVNIAAKMEVQLKHGAYRQFLHDNPSIREQVQQELLVVMRRDINVRASCRHQIKQELTGEIINNLTADAIDRERTKSRQEAERQLEAQRRDNERRDHREGEYVSRIRQLEEELRQAQTEIERLKEQQRRKRDRSRSRSNSRDVRRR